MTNVVEGQCEHFMSTNNKENTMDQLLKAIAESELKLDNIVAKGMPAMVLSLVLLLITLKKS